MIFHEPDYSGGDWFIDSALVPRLKVQFYHRITKGSRSAFTTAEIGSVSQQYINDTPRILLDEDNHVARSIPQQLTRTPSRLWNIDEPHYFTCLT